LQKEDEQKVEVVFCLFLELCVKLIEINS